MNVTFALGHNNDQGVLLLTETDQLLHKHRIKFLGDGGYHHSRIVTPESVPILMEQQQKDERSVVEVVIGLGKGFAIAADKCRQSPELHQYALSVVYQLVQLKMNEDLLIYSHVIAVA